MKTTILAFVCFFSFSAFSQSIPWADSELKCARHTGLNYDGKFLESFTQYNWYAVAWKEVVDLMAEHMGKPDLKLSFEYLQYRSGYQVMTEVQYAKDCQSFPESDAEVLRLKELQLTRKLKRDDFKGPKWIHMVSAMDTEEANCLALSKKNGKLSGCGDQWQDGVTEDEAVCFKGKTYLRCHITCLEKIYDRTIELESGYCK